MFRFRGSGSLAGGVGHVIESWLFYYGAAGSVTSARCRRVGLGGRRLRWGWSVGSVVGTPYRASLTHAEGVGSAEGLCAAEGKANPLGAVTIP